MAYSLVRVKMGVFRDPFKGQEDDTSFKTEAYPELDEYLSTMEQRGWRIVSVNPLPDNAHLYFTFHRPED